MLTRTQYMNKECTHHEYYNQFGKYLVGLVSAHIGKQRILASTDPHLNDIPLAKWDALHPAILMAVGPKLAKANSGGISLSDTVCSAKAAARIIRSQENKKDQ